MKLSVLIPVYNEIATISKVVDLIVGLPIEKQLVIVDDFSTDGTRQLLKEKIAKKHPSISIFYHSENRGKGAAVKTALSHAQGDYSVIQDADLEYKPRDFLALLDAADKNNADAVFGSRFLKTWRATSFWHYLVNSFLTGLTNCLFSARLTDMETCYKMIRTSVFKDLNIQSERFEIEVELAAKLLKRGTRIIEVPVSYKGRSYHQGKKITWKDGCIAVVALFRLKFCT